MEWPIPRTASSARTPRCSTTSRSPPRGRACRSPWADSDIGSPAVAGSASYANGVFTVNGAGRRHLGDERPVQLRLAEPDRRRQHRGPGHRPVQHRSLGQVGDHDQTVHRHRLRLRAARRHTWQRHHLPVRLQHQCVRQQLHLPQRLAQAHPLRVHHHRLLLTGRHHLDPGRHRHHRHDRSRHRRTRRLLALPRQPQHIHLRQRQRHAGGSSLPVPWADSDIGSPAVAGSASYANGVFTVNGAGARHLGDEPTSPTTSRRA